MAAIIFLIAQTIFFTFNLLFYQSALSKDSNFLNPGPYQISLNTALPIRPEKDTPLNSVALKDVE